MKFIVGFSIITIFLIILLVIRKNGKNLKKYQKLVVSVSLMFFTFFELVFLGKIPGFFGDEAFAMYDSWSIAHYGIDSNLMHNAVYSLSSGGQSVLYEHLAVPLMKIFGMNLAAFRYPMALLTVLSVVFLVYSLLRSNMNSTAVTGITISLTTAEWLLMYGRWSMDCSIVVPFYIFILGLVFLSLSNQKKLYGYLSLIMISLLTYCYVGVWIILPFLYIIVLFSLLKNKNFDLKDVLISIGISLIILIPIICYILIQFCGVKSFKCLWFTVGSLSSTRMGSSMISFKGNILNNIIENIATGLIQVITGNDSMLHSSIPGFEVLYFLMFIMAVVGLTHTIYHKKDLIIDFLLKNSLILLLIVMLVQPNFNHWSIVLITLNIWSGIGLGIILNIRKRLVIKETLCLIILISTFSFTKYYFTDYLDKELTINQFPGYIINLKQTQNFVSEIDKLGSTYYGMPFDCEAFMRCLKKANPREMMSLQVYQGDLPDQLQAGKVVYIVLTKDTNKYDYLNSLSKKKIDLNGQNYTIFYQKE